MESCTIGRLNTTVPHQCYVSAPFGYPTVISMTQGQTWGEALGSVYTERRYPPPPCGQTENITFPHASDAVGKNFRFRSV